MSIDLVVELTQALSNKLATIAGAATRNFADPVNSVNSLEIDGVQTSIGGIIPMKPQLVNAPAIGDDKSDNSSRYI